MVLPPKRFAEYQDTPLWQTVSEAVDELVATREIVLATAPEYVIGYICERLVRSRAIETSALRDEP